MSKTQEDVQVLLDCFSAMDGGVQFVKYREFINSIKDSSVESDKKIMEALKITAAMVKYF